MIVKGNVSTEEEVISLNCSNTQNIASSLMENPSSETYDNYSKLDFKLASPSSKEDVELNEYHLKNNVGSQLETNDNNLKYCTLPKEFFGTNNIPPPLVCKSWLRLVYRKIKKKESDLGHLSSEDNDNAEDSIPLSQLQKALQNADDGQCKNDLTIENLSKTVRPKRSSTKALKTYKKLIDSCDSDVDSIDSNSNDEILRVSKTERRRSRSKKTDILIINRKRGRPKKKDKPASTIMPEDEENNEVSENKIDEWMEPDNNYESDLEIPWHQETKEKGEITPSNQEHDYFKVEKNSETMNENANDSTEKKGKKKGEFLVKVEKIDGKTKSAYLCTECNKSFSAASTLKYHMRIHEGTLIKCTECDKGFTTNYLLKCHMRIHNGDLFMCHKCGRGFTTAELLKVHSRSHTGDRPFTCHICGKAFPSASNLRQHKETHDSVRKYLCFQCGASFSQKRCLDGHMLSHGDKNHICTVCGKLWARKSDLNEHMRVHTGSKPYSCNMCPQKFTQASSLRRHQIVHMETKPIPCLTCGKMFKCEDYYKRHVKKHEKEAEPSINSTKE